MGRLTLLRRLLLTAATLGLVVIVGLVAQRAALLGQGDDSAEWRIEADVALTGFRLDQVGEEGMELRLSAAGARLTEEARRVDAEGLDLIVFKDGLEALRLTADRGDLELDSGTISVRGDGAPATLTVAGGPTVTAPAMIWNPDDRTVRTQGGAAITGQGLLATGATAVASLADESVRLSGTVEVTWTR
ncbi:MAG: LPS export ABC transporter periplasmic protein LptC [Nitrospirae bacterium]|nr:LPS export ABC transporter periplasmic protein LptC [Nitrospirota bacterium]